jgi:AraC-like DNA-binding protein
MLFQKKYFLKLFFIIFIISLLTTGTTLYTVYYISNTTRAAKQEALITDSLSLADQRYTTILQEVDMLYTLMWTNDLVQQFLRAPSPGASDREQMNTYLQSIFPVNPLVESIAIYNYQAGEYLNSGLYDVDMRLFFSTFLNNMSLRGSSNFSKRKNYFRFTSLEPDEEKSPGPLKQVIGIMYYSIDTNGNKHNCITINLNALKMSDFILRNSDSGGFLLNEFGTIICGGRQALGAPLRNRVQWSQKLEAESRRTGSFVEKINGENKLVTYYKVSEGTWTFYHISDILSLHPFNKEMRLYFLPVTLAVILFSLTVTILLSSLLYLPVKRIVNRLDGENHHITAYTNHKGRDEFAFVNAMFTSLSNRIALLETENTSYLSHVKVNFLRQVLDYGIEGSYSKDDWMLYDIAVMPENLFISLVKWDEDENTVLNEKVFEGLIRESANRCLRDSYRLETITTKKGEIALLMNQIAGGGDPENELFLSLERFHGFICRTSGLPISVSISIGGMADSFNECETCYHTAQELVKQRFVLGYGRIITRNLIDASLLQGLNYPDELAEELETNIRGADKTLFLANYDRLLEILHRYIYQEVVSVLLQVIMRCLRAMNFISPHNIPVKVAFDEFNLIFSTMHTLGHTRVWFSRMFDEYLLAIQNTEDMKSDKYYQLAKQIQQYVMEQYADPNLNVDHLAEIFGYSANYLSKIYKNLTGLYLHEYIKNVRIQHAKNLLKETKRSIHEISEMTGFVNYNYFFSLFKKESGLTPTVYRYRFTGEDTEVQERERGIGASLSFFGEK